MSTEKNPTSGKRASQKRSGRRRSRWPEVLVSIIAIVYLAGVFCFSHKSFPGTSVNADSRSFKDLDNLFLREAKDEPVTFTGKDGVSLTLSQKDIGMTYEQVDAPTIDQNAWKWPKEAFKDHPYEVQYKMDYQEDQLEQLIQDSDFPVDGEEPEDAYLEIDEKGPTIVKEKEGNRVEMEDLKAFIVEGLQGEESQLDASGLYKEPAVRSDDKDLVAEKEQWDKKLAASVTFDFGDRKFTFDRKNMIDAITKGDDGKYMLKPKTVSNWVANVAYQTDTRAKDHKFKGTGVGEVTVKGGYYGWWTDVAKTTAKVEEALDKGGQQVITPVYKQTARSRTRDDIGNTYIEIDLSRQHVWFYKNGELFLESDVVTGWPAKGRMTPTGVDMILYKDRKATLRGTLWNGTPYASPVEYWMPVDGIGDGLHDSSWRKTFGGEIYLHQGSNGCINFPIEKVKVLFENVEAGTPVIIYESTTNYSEGRSNGLR
jgi:vancomycin resistance protein YoaR